MTSQEVQKLILSFQNRLLPHAKPKSIDLRADWNLVISKAERVQSDYLFNTVDYQNLYVKGAADYFFDFSLIFYEDAKPIMVWPLNFFFQDGLWNIQSNAGPILPPLYLPTLQHKQIKRILQNCISFIAECSALHSFKIPKTTFSLSYNLPWARLTSSCISEINYQQQLFLNLKNSFEETKLEFRKSFKPLANKGKKLWKSERLTSISSTQIKEIRDFHEVIAGRKTRSNDTWNKQCQMINEKEAFAITLRDHHNALVAAAIFNLTKDIASYSVGIYDRSLFDQPLGHTVQMLAVEYVQALELKEYFLGNRNYSFEVPNPSLKESSIGFFKEGFSNNTKAQATAQFQFGDK